MYVYQDFKRPKTIIPACTVTNWSGFSNQPAGDGVEVVSDNAADTMYCTIVGTTNGTGALTHETITLTGTDAVSTTKTDWGNIYGVILSKADGSQITRATGTITVREASADQAITTITATNFHSGMMIIRIPGLNASILSASGNLYWSTLTAPATSTTGVAEIGKTAVGIRVDEYLSLISDNTGASLQVIVYDN